MAQTRDGVEMHVMAAHVSDYEGFVLDVLDVLVSGKDSTRALDDLDHAHRIKNCMDHRRADPGPEVFCVPTCPFVGGEG